MQRPHVLSGGRYPVLRALAIIYVVGAALAAAATLLTLGYFLFAARFAWSDRLILAVGTLAAGFFVVVSALAVAEVLKLIIDIEHNTRVAGQDNRMRSAVAEAAAMAGGSHTNRLDALDEETAEAALLRGH